jgi:hypothetical protein
MNVQLIVLNIPPNGHPMITTPVIILQCLNSKTGCLFIVPVRVLLGDIASLNQDEVRAAYSKLIDSYAEDPTLTQFSKSQKTLSNISSQQVIYAENNVNGSRYKHLEVFIPTDEGGRVIHYFSSPDEFASGIERVGKLLSTFKTVKQE